jgi:hypothetical protein
MGPDPETSDLVTLKHKQVIIESEEVTLWRYMKSRLSWGIVNKFYGK